MQRQSRTDLTFLTKASHTVSQDTGTFTYPMLAPVTCHSSAPISQVLSLWSMSPGFTTLPPSGKTEMCSLT